MTEKHPKELEANKKEASPKMASSRKSACCMGFGAVFTIMGAMSAIFWPTLFFSQLQSRMIVTPTSMSFDIWKETPIPMFLECYLFNITNVEEILAGTATKIHVVELGPYVYEETHTKTNLTWHDHNSTVTFYNQRWWHYVPEMSNGSLSDEITSINPVIATVAYFMRHRLYPIRLAVGVFLSTVHKDMFTTANVSSWLFDGIDDPVMDIASQFPELGFDLPFDKFGWFYDRNGSMVFDGSFNMNTGASDFSRLGNIEMWNHSNRTFYKDQCGEVKGSTGELWAPELGQPEVAIFASDVCTYMTLAKNESVTIDGIEGVMYASNDSIFDNGHNYPQMACYCDDITSNDCLPSGALNVSACRYGAPAFVSLPHFLHTDPHYPSKIEGLDPNDNMTFRIALEMYTGVPLAVAAQLQINMLVRYITGISINNRLPEDDTLVPMFWFRQEVRITPEYAAMARQALNLRYGLPYAFYGITGIGLLLLFSGIIILVRRLLKSPDTEPILDNGSQESLH